MESKARIDEDIGPAGASFDAARRTGTFQGTDARRTDSDDAAPFLFGTVDGSRCFVSNAIEFTVHFVIFYIFFFYRAERAKADMERHEDEFYAFGFDFSSSSSVKCRPAVGAAAEPFSRA